MHLLYLPSLIALSQAKSSSLLDELGTFTHRLQHAETVMMSKDSELQRTRQAMDDQTLRYESQMQTAHQDAQVARANEDAKLHDVLLSAEHLADMNEQERIVRAAAETELKSVQMQLAVIASQRDNAQHELSITQCNHSAVMMQQSAIAHGGVPAADLVVEREARICAERDAQMSKAALQLYVAQRAR